MIIELNGNKIILKTSKKLKPQVMLLYFKIQTSAV